MISVVFQLISKNVFNRLPRLVQTPRHIFVVYSLNHHVKNVTRNYTLNLSHNQIEYVIVSFQNSDLCV